MTTHLECDVITTDAAIYWLHDGEPLGGGGSSDGMGEVVRLALTPGGGLVIKYAQPSDEGWYKCVAGSSGGTVVAEAYLSVIPSYPVSMVTSAKEV